MPGRCPVCKRTVLEDHADGPFCGERCRLVDLGRWLDGAYRIPDPDPAPGLDPSEPGQDRGEPGSSPGPSTDGLLN